MIVTQVGYREKSLGRPAIFSIPTAKLTERLEVEIATFLIKNYGHAWSRTEGVQGYWLGMSDGVYTKFEVSFVGAERIPVLKRFLGDVAVRIDEECIYLLTGEDSWVYLSATSVSE